MSFKQSLIINSDLGYIWHVPGYLAQNNHAELYTVLRDDITWEQPIVKLYGNVFKPARGIYAMANDDVIPYSFSGDKVAPRPWLPSVLKLKESIERDFGIRGLNFALLNYYYNGVSKLGYHSDDERDMIPGEPIVGVVLGSGRDFLVKAKSKEAKREYVDVIKTYIDAGDIFVMEGNTQRHFTHSVPSRANAGPRMSITFRKMKTKK